MKTKPTETTKNERGGKCGHYLARGALLWGPLYATGVSGMAYLIAPAASMYTFSYSELLLHALIICPSFGAAGGYLRWRLAGTESEGAAASKHRKRRVLIHRLKSHRKAA